MRPGGTLPWKSCGFVRRRDDAPAKKLQGRGDGRYIVLGKARAVMNIHESNDVAPHSPYKKSKSLISGGLSFGSTVL